MPLTIICSPRTAGIVGFRSPRPLGPQPQAGLRLALRPRDVLRLPPARSSALSAPDRPLDYPGQFPCQRFDLLAVLPLEHDPRQRLGPRVPDEYAPPPVEALFRLPEPGRETRNRLEGGLLAN